MNAILIFTARIILGMVFGILLTRLFKPDWTLFHGVAVGMGLVAAAYALSFHRNKKT